MGVLFIRYPSSESYIACLKCGTPIVSTEEKVKISHDGRPAGALHYQKILNTVQGTTRKAKKMRDAGFHFRDCNLGQSMIFRDVRCISCSTRLGYYNEFDKDESQYWCEGTFAIQWKYLKIVTKSASRPMTMTDMFTLQRTLIPESDSDLSDMSDTDEMEI